MFPGIWKALGYSNAYYRIDNFLHGQRVNTKFVSLSLRNSIGFSKWVGLRLTYINLYLFLNAIKTCFISFY